VRNKLKLKILLVDDEPALTEPLSRLLTREGYIVDVAIAGQAGWKLASGGNYDLLILDWMLPQLTGLAGADDYLVKPFELRELLARVRALLRRAQAIEDLPAAKSKLQVDDLELDLDNQLAYIGGRSIELSEKETQLLGYLMTHTGQVLTHSQIQVYLWGDKNPPSSNVLAALVRLLRRKIEVKGSPELIQTVYGKGYRIGRG
jgi:two-component system, OmpR family, manganese sensing response regulator